MPLFCVCPRKKRKQSCKRASSESEKVTTVPASPASAVSRGPSPSRWHDVGDAVIGGLVTALSVTKEVGAVFPPLQGAAGGLLALVEVFKKASSNKDDIQTLTEYVNRLNKMVQTSMPSKYESCPKALKERLERFSKQINAITIDIQRLEAQSYASKLLKAQAVEGKIAECIRSISWFVHDLLVGSMILIELAVDSLEFAISDGFQHMDGRFDQIKGRIDDISEQINQLHGSTNPLPRNVAQARFDYYRSNRVQCESGTRLDALATVYHWLLPNDARLEHFPRPLFPVRQDAPVFWMYGLAGTGKSTLAHTIATWCEEVRFLGASFFCAREGERSNTQLIIPSIANQLCALSPAFREEVTKAMVSNADIHASLASRQLQKLVVEPLRAVGNEFPACVIIVDALDECDDVEAVSVILKALALYVTDFHPLKFIITSRPVNNIDAGFRQKSLLARTQQFALSQIPPDITRRDITRYLHSRLAAVKEMFLIMDGWPKDDEITALVDLASGLFIFAATTIKFIEDADVDNPEAQLKALLNTNAESQVSRTCLVTHPYARLDALYLQVLHTAFPNITTERSMRAEIKIILGSIALLRDQLSPGALENLIRLPRNTIRRALRGMHSIIIVPSTDAEVIRIIHKSFSDFLVDSNRCTAKQYLVKPSIQHTVITKACLQMLETLTRDICHIGNESLVNDEIPDISIRVQRYITPELQYASRYWPHHLAVAEVDQEILDQLACFCTQHMLHWLEILSLLGGLDVATETLQYARAALEVLPLPRTDVPTLLYDCERAVRSFYPALSASCFQAYRCVVPFSPVSTLLHVTYVDQARQTVKLRSGTLQVWSPNMIIAEAHSGWVQCVAYSPDGFRIVSGSNDNSIRLWDARTGAQLHVLQGHTGHVLSVTFSPTGKQILSGSADRTIKVWDASTGACLETWQCHQHEVRSVCYSPLRPLAASASYDHTVVLWDLTKSGAHIAKFEDHIAGVEQVVFSRDGALLLSASHDGTSRVWNVEKAILIQTLYHPVDVMSVAVSHNDQLIACGLGDNSAVLWSRDDWTQLRVLEGQHGSLIWAVDFSSDDKTLATGSWDRKVCLWDVGTGLHVETLHEHTDQVLSLQFSPDGLWLVTGSCDNSVRIWEFRLSRTHRARSWGHSRGDAKDGERVTLQFDVTTGMYKSTGQGPEHHASPVRAIALSADGSLLATSAWGGKIRLWNVASGKRIKTLLMVPEPRGVTKWLSWSRRGNLLASTGPDKTVRIWDIEAGSCFQACHGHSDGGTVVLFTHDNQHIVSSAEDGAIRSWNIGLLASDEQHQTLFQGTGPVYAIALSHDSKMMLSGTLDGSFPNQGRGYPALRLHDRISGDVLWILEYLPGIITSLAFSRDCTRALSGSSNGQIFLHDLSKIRDTSDSEVECQTTATRSIADGTEIEHVSFSVDERAIVSEASFTLLEPALRPLSASDTESSAPVCILVNNWLWRAHPELRRICWIPPDYRHIQTAPQIYRGNMVTKGNLIVFGTNNGRTVIVDASEC